MSAGLSGGLSSGLFSGLSVELSGKMSGLFGELLVRQFGGTAAVLAGGHSGGLFGEPSGKLFGGPCAGPSVELFGRLSGLFGELLLRQFGEIPGVLLSGLAEGLPFALPRRLSF